jgi:pimeloyl-ACP methyl ester carboxylesterase
MLTLQQPRTLSFASLSPHGFHRVAYYEWGDPRNDRVAICVHGLSRNGRDFDVLGEALAQTHRVIAVDMPGRGASQWLSDANDYVFPTYLTTLTALVARSNASEVAWVGTSMGALLGMVMAAQRDTPVSRLVVNDAGPSIEPVALARIGDYLGLAPTFATLAEADAYIRIVSAPFGTLTDAQWDHLTRTSVARNPDGRYALTYDPGIAVPFKSAAAPPDLWPIWDAVRCPTLVLRGAQSDLLSAATAQAMTARGPKARLVEFPGVGHAPMLLSADQLAPVVAFLREGS